MPENQHQEPRLSHRVIEVLAARAALETPGVLRLEPTIQDLLSRISPTGLPPKRDAGTQRHEGVTATIIDGIASVHLDIATDIAFTALDVAETVQRRVGDGIRDSGLVPGKVNISILAMEQSNSTG